MVSCEDDVAFDCEMSCTDGRCDRACESEAWRDVAVRDADPTVVLSATLHLMSAYACNRCPRIACMVQRHLSLLAVLPAQNGTLRACCRQLAQQWSALSAKPQPVATPPGWLERLATTITH